MKKICTLLCVLFILCGCKTINVDNIEDELDMVFDELNSISYYRINNTMPYYSYYLPSDTGEDELDSDSIVLKYGNSSIIMNLNISGIVNTRYYTDHKYDDDGFFVSDYKIYENAGSYKNCEGLNKDYVYRLYKYDSEYVVHLRTSDMNYYGTVKICDIKTVSKHLMTIAKNTIVNTDSVIADFSNKDVIDYQRKQIDLFDNSLPTSGELASMLVEGASIGDDSNLSPTPEKEKNNNEE